MPWIPSDLDINTNPKTKRLTRRLGITLPTAVGHLHLLWHWCMRHAVNGDITKVDQEDIAEVMMWPGEPQKLVDTLCEVGFIDVSSRPDGSIESLRIHDWHHYAGKYERQRSHNAQRQARYRNSEQKETSQEGDVVTSPLRNGDITGQRREEESTGEKSTEEKNSMPPAAHDAGAAGFSQKPSSQPNIESPLAMAVRQVCRKGLVLSSRDREKLESALAGLEREGATVAQVEEFGRKCGGHWVGYDSRTKQSRAPTITQVLEHWREVLALPEPVRVKSRKELDALAARFVKQK